MNLILVINPGSTSTKIALYKDEKEIFNYDINHSAEELLNFDRIIDQSEFRLKKIIGILNENKFNLNDITAIAARGGLLRPVKAGTYLINENMVNDLQERRYGEHASNLGAVIAFSLSNTYKIPSYIADPVSVDEFTDLARLTGLKEINRVSLDHPLNVRAILIKYCNEFNKDFNKINAVVVHLGGGISVSAINEGKIVDVNNANEGGPFSTNRSGGLPSIDLVNMSFSGEYTLESLSKLLLSKGGLISYLNTNDLKSVLKKINEGDNNSKEVVDALCYQISKEIGAMSCVLKGKVDVIILTGGMSYSEYFTKKIEDRISFIAPIKIYPGSNEMEALSFAVLRILNGIDRYLEY
jgi:butyrate kinase